jgi:hypothetical protein
MHLLDIAIVSLIILCAALYLYKVFRPRKNKGASCGCGSVDCKVPKPKIQSGKS